MNLTEEELVTEPPATEEPTTEAPTEEPATEAPTEEPATEPVEEKTMIVAGSEAEIFGTVWDGNNEDNLMTANPDGTFTKTYTVEKAYSSVQLKSVLNGADWYGDKTGSNVTFSLTGAGDFTVTATPADDGYITIPFMWWATAMTTGSTARTGIPVILKMRCLRFVMMFGKSCSLKYPRPFCVSLCF